jgi:hypothetical protein
LGGIVAIVCPKETVQPNARKPLRHDWDAGQDCAGGHGKVNKIALSSSVGREAFMEFPMTMITETNLSTGLSNKVSAFFTGLVEWVTMVGETLSRRDEILRLYALSDAELALEGLKREDIVAHVFRDRMGV